MSLTVLVTLLPTTTRKTSEEGVVTLRLDAPLSVSSRRGELTDPGGEVWTRKRDEWETTRSVGQGLKGLRSKWVVRGPPHISETGVTESGDSAKRHGCKDWTTTVTTVRDPDSGTNLSLPGFLTTTIHPPG